MLLMFLFMFKFRLFVFYYWCGYFIVCCLILVFVLLLNRLCLQLIAGCEFAVLGFGVLAFTGVLHACSWLLEFGFYLVVCLVFAIVLHGGCLLLMCFALVTVLFVMMLFLLSLIGIVCELWLLFYFGSVFRLLLLCCGFMICGLDYVWVLFLVIWL